MADGGGAAVHLTPQGRARAIVRQMRTGTAPVLAVAGCADALAQGADWRSRHDVPDALLVAGADALGCVRLWWDHTGAHHRELSAGDRRPLVAVAWAAGVRFVAAASAAALLLWDLGAGPAAPEPVRVALGAAAGPVVMLAGDPLAPVFCLATERGGVWRVDARSGAVLARFAVPLPPAAAPLTAASVGFAVPAGRVPGISRPPRWGTPSLPASPGGRASEPGAPPTTPTLRIPPPPAAAAASASPATQLLLTGDAAGSLMMFDFGAGSGSPAMHAWPHLHRLAVSSVQSSAAVVVSAARDGQVAVLEPLTGQRLSSLRCRSGGRSSALAQWHHAVRSPLLQQEHHVQVAVRLAQALGARTAEQWARQVAEQTGDRLDRTENVGAAAVDQVPGYFAWAQLDPDLPVRGFPTLVPHLALTNDRLLVASGTHIHACHVTEPPPAVAGGRSRNRQRRGCAGAVSARVQGARELADELSALRVESEEERGRRVRRAEEQSYLDDRFGGLGLDPQEQI
ncbi:hypothetical protein LPJ66_011677, partial [Kickxella alabastrina]